MKTNLEKKVWWDSLDFRDGRKEEEKTEAQTSQRDTPQCRICCRSIYSPYVRYDEDGKIHEGCVSPDHAGHYIETSEYARWYNRPQAKQIRKGLKWRRLV